MKFNFIQKIFVTLFVCFEKIISRSVSCMSKFLGINIGAIYTIILMSFFITSCSLPTKKFNFLPNTNKIASSNYGAYVKVKLHSQFLLRGGEIITVDSAKIVLLNNHNKLDTLRFDKMISMRIRYSKPKFYLWAISFSTFIFIPNLGGILEMTDLTFRVANANIAGGLILGLIGNQSGVIRGKRLTPEELRKFARYPQGIPPDLDVKLIDRNIEGKKFLNKFVYYR
jgi:hypothetical protein